MVGLFPNFGISGGSLGLATLMTARGAVVHQWMRSPSAQSAIDGTHSARGFDKSRSPEALCNNIVKFSAPLGFVCFLQDWTISIMIYATQASSLLNFLRNMLNIKNKVQLFCIRVLSQPEACSMNQDCTFQNHFNSIR